MTEKLTCPAKGCDRPHLRLTQHQKAISETDIPNCLGGGLGGQVPIVKEGFATLTYYR